MFYCYYFVEKTWNITFLPKTEGVQLGKRQPVSSVFFSRYILLVPRNQAAFLTLIASEKTFLSAQIHIVYCTHLPLATTLSILSTVHTYLWQRFSSNGERPCI